MSNFGFYTQAVYSSCSMPWKVILFHQRITKTLADEYEFFINFICSHRISTSRIRHNLFD